MYKFGDIIYSDNLIFEGNIRDKKEKRPCVVLCESDQKGKRKLYVFKVTSKGKQFKHYPDQYMLVSKNIKKPKMLSFICYSWAIEVDYNSVHSLNTSLNETDKKILKEKMRYIINNDENISKRKKYAFLLKKIRIENLENKKDKTKVLKKHVN